MAAILVQCVVVLYKQSPAQARSLVTLLDNCRADPSLGSRIAITVHDNSPEPASLESRQLPEGIEYFHAPGNPGLAVAYNRALGIARSRGIPWLLTLDHDTAVDGNFLRRLLAAVGGEVPTNVCAFVPELVGEGIVLSPQIVGGVLYHRLPLGFSGIPERSVVAFNSASCLKVQAVAAIGGFPEAYWLDYLDHIVYHRLQAAGGRVYVLDAQLNHSLSVQNLDSDVSPDRYANVLAAEWRYVRDISAARGRLIHRVRLLKRTTLHALHLKNKRFARLTLNAALRVRFPDGSPRPVL